MAKIAASGRLGLQAAAIALIAYYPAFTLAGAALLSVLFTITSAATFALIPVLASALGMTLARANSFLEVVRSLGMLAGPVAGGVLVGWMGSTNALLIDAASFTLLLLVRSEEHTSELQSLMRISYAVFCLKKKKKTTRKMHTTTITHTNPAKLTYLPTPHQLL